MKTPLAASLVALLACTHAPPADHDWEHGLDGSLSVSVAPVGPIESDQVSFNLIRQREGERALNSKATFSELDSIVGSSSQVLASAMAMPLFQAGVYQGQPALIDRACAAARRVTHPLLRSTGNVESVLQACGALSAGPQGADACADGEKKLRDAYALLSSEKGTEAGHLAADAVRSLRDRCPKIQAPLRTPVDPSSRGFLIVWTLHANDAPPATFLVGMGAPAVSDAINEAFLRGVQATKGLAHNP